MNPFDSFRDNKRFLDHGTKRRINKEQSANQLIANELIGIYFNWNLASIYDVSRYFIVNKLFFVLLIIPTLEMKIRISKREGRSIFLKNPEDGIEGCYQFFNFIFNFIVYLGRDVCLSTCTPKIMLRKCLPGIFSS